MWKDVALSGAPGSLDLPDHNDAPSWFLKCGKIGIFLVCLPGIGSPDLANHYGLPPWL